MFKNMIFLKDNYVISNEKNFDKVESNEYKIQQRKFWDGGLMNNTPLMIAIYRHRDYWYYTRGIANNIPSLGIAIVNLHPSVQEEIPIDHDGVLNRNNDITFSDRIDYRGGVSIAYFRLCRFS